MARILIIEDNAANMQLMVYLLNAFGHTTLEATDGEAGLTVIQNESVDIILCDLQIPRLDGYEVARRIKMDPELKDIPLIAVTAYAMVGDRDKVLSAGFDGYISKPINPEIFTEEVEGYLSSNGSDPHHTHTESFMD